MKAKRLNIRIKRNVLAELEQAANEKDMCLSHYLRYAGLLAKEQPRVFPDLAEKAA